MDFADSSAFLKASVVEMSGLGAPSRTPTPMPVRAMSAREPGTTRSCLIHPSRPGGGPAGHRRRRVDRLGQPGCGEGPRLHRPAGAPLAGLPRGAEFGRALVARLLL